MLNGLRVDADELNFLAKSIERFDDSEYSRFCAAVAEFHGADVSKLINLSFNIDHYTLVRDVTDLAKIGKEHTLNVRGGLTKEELDTLDFAQIGRELLSSGKGIPTDHGLLFENEEVPFQTVYEGTTFPPYYWRGDTVISVLLKYDGESEQLCLPVEEISIDKALKRLGAPALENCAITVESTAIMDEGWQDRVETILEYQGLHMVNQLAEVLVRKDLDRGKLMWVTNYAEVADSDSIIRLANNLEDFLVIPGAETPADVGEYIVQHEVGYEAGEYLTDYVDYTSLGEYIVAERDGEFLGGAFVCMEDGCDYRQIMGTESHGIEMGGM